MIWLWIILITATILNIIWIISAGQDDIDEIFIPVIVLLLGVGLIGWVLVGNAITFNKQNVKLENLEIIKGSSFIIITDLNDNHYIFKKKIDFDNITDTTSFFTRQGKNIYGGTNTKEDIFYYIYNDTVPNLDTITVIKKNKINGDKL
jgi:hypothetical protein